MVDRKRMVSHSRNSPRLTREAAESLAIEALVFLATDESRLAPFLRATGLDPADIRREADSPEFLAGVLDFLMSDDSLLLVFAGHRGLDPNLIAAARRILMPGTAGEGYST